MAVALLGLRSGSKGIKDKNIKLLFGKPLFYWILNTIFESHLFSVVIVSSDSQPYLDLVNELFLASLRLPNPTSLASIPPWYDYVVDAIDWADRFGLIPEGEDVFCRFHAIVLFNHMRTCMRQLKPLYMIPMLILQFC